MKILMLSGGAGAVPVVTGGADSALLRQGEPIFTCDEADSRELKVALAVRVSKLGLHIPERYARRHYDAFAAVGLHIPAVDDGVPPLFHDRAVSPGQWIDADEAGDDLSLSAARRPLPGRTSETLDATVKVDRTSLGVDAAVAWLSKTMTLKTGDIIIFADTALPFGHPLPDTELSATVGGKESLKVRIK